MFGAIPFPSSNGDSFVELTKKLQKRLEMAPDTVRDAKGRASEEDFFLAGKAAEVLSHFGTNVPEYSSPEAVSGEVEV